MNNPRCPRCGGYVFDDESEMTCVNCGRPVACATIAVEAEIVRLLRPHAAVYVGSLDRPAERHSRPLHPVY